MLRKEGGREGESEGATCVARCVAATCAEPPHAVTLEVRRPAGLSLPGEPDPAGLRWLPAGGTTTGSVVWRRGAWGGDKRALGCRLSGFERFCIAAGIVSGSGGFGGTSSCGCGALWLAGSSGKAGTVKPSLGTASASTMAGQPGHTTGLERLGVIHACYEPDLEPLYEQDYGPRYELDHGPSYAPGRGLRYEPDAGRAGPPSASPHRWNFGPADQRR